jgi:rRNA maturation RNase YbeY
MIDFYAEISFTFSQPDEIQKWISTIILQENCEVGAISYIFCDDQYLHKLNVEFLNHDTLTDIISFDNSLGNQIHGEIYISIDRIHDNAKVYNASFDDELHRVMIHGILHFCGYKDKSEEEQARMTSKENESLLKRNFL